MNFILKTDHDDIDRIVSLINRAYRNTDGERRWTTENHLVEGDRITLDAMEALINNPDIDLVLGMKNDKIISCLSAKRASGYIEFGTFAVEPSMHGHGYGARLLHYAEDLYRQHTSFFQVTVVSQNQELMNFYIRRGYKVQDQRLPYPVQQNVGVPKIEDIDLTVLRKAIELSS